MRSQPAVETSSYCRVMPVAGGRTIVSSVQESGTRQTALPTIVLTSVP